MNTGIDPCQQVLLSGSSLLRVKNEDTLMESEIVNGSIITVLYVGNGAIKPSMKRVKRTSSVKLDKMCFELGNVEMQALGLERTFLSMKHDLLVLEEKGPIFPSDRKVEYRNLKTNLNLLKEELKKLVQVIDKMKIAEEAVYNKSKKKKLINLTCSVFDEIEKLLQIIDKCIVEQSS